MRCFELCSFLHANLNHFIKYFCCCNIFAKVANIVGTFTNILYKDPQCKPSYCMAYFCSSFLLFLQCYYESERQRSFGRYSQTKQYICQHTPKHHLPAPAWGSAVREGPQTLHKSLYPLIFWQISFVCF